MINDSAVRSSLSPGTPWWALSENYICIMLKIDLHAENINKKKGSPALLRHEVYSGGRGNDPRKITLSASVTHNCTADSTFISLPSFTQFLIWIISVNTFIICNKPHSYAVRRLFTLLFWFEITFAFIMPHMQLCRKQAQDICKMSLSILLPVGSHWATRGDVRGNMALLLRNKQVTTNFGVLLYLPWTEGLRARSCVEWPARHFGL